MKNLILSPPSSPLPMSDGLISFHNKYNNRNNFMGIFSGIGKALSGTVGSALNSFTGGAIGALGGIAGNLVGDLFGIESDAEKTAKLQMQMQRETNEMNYKIWQEQRQAEVDMWNMNNDYNTPAAQRQRLEDAGFSPYAMLGQGGNIGMSNSAPGTGQAPTMQAPQIPHLESSFMQGLRTMRETTASQLALSQAGLADSEAKRIETLLPIESNQILENINYLKKLGLTQDELREVYRQQSANLFEDASFKRATYVARFRQQLAFTNEAEAEATFMSLNVQERQFASKYFEPQAWVNFSTSLQNLANMIIDGKVKTNQAKLILKQISETYWRMMNFKQQYNINKPQETIAGFENAALNSDNPFSAPDFGNSPDNIVGYGIGMTPRQQYDKLFRQVFYNKLQSSLNNSLSLNIDNLSLGREQSISHGIFGDMRFGWQKSVNFLNDILGIGKDASQIGMNLYNSSPHYNYNYSIDSYGRSYSTY